jgi:hypothetical protein
MSTRSESTMTWSLSNLGLQTVRLSELFNNMGLLTIHRSKHVLIIMNTSDKACLWVAAGLSAIGGIAYWLTRSEPSTVIEEAPMQK